MIFSVVVSLFTPLMNITVGQDSFIARNLILPIKQYEQSISVNLDSKYLSKRNKMLLPENMVTKEGSITTKATEESNTMSNSAQTSTMDSLGASEIGKTINWLSIIIVIYFIGAALFFIRFLANFIWIFGYVIKYTPQQILGMKVIRFEKNMSPFSFLNFIFISNK